MKIKITSIVFYFFIIIIAVVAMVFTPFLGIWCINTLFGAAIAYTWKNWVAFFLLFFVFNIMLNFKIQSK